MKRSFHSINLRGLIVAATLGLLAAPVQADVVGLWEFENSGSLTASTIGSPLVLSGSDAAVAGSGGADTGATQVGIGSYYAVNHGIAANGGGLNVNQYSLLFDVSYPTTSAGNWRTLFSTDADVAANDGEYFIHPSDESWGVGDLTYTDNATTGQFFSSADTWYRAILTFDAGSAAKLYIDGTLAGTHNATVVDDRFSLGSVFNLLGDNDGDDEVLNLSNFAVFNTTLSAGQVSALGGAGSQINAVPEPSSLMLMLGGLGFVGLRRRR